MAEKNFIDVGSSDARICECVGGDLHDQRLHRFSVKATEGCVRPSDDATRHQRSPAELWSLSGAKHYDDRSMQQINPVI
jgi:hypothetical protein